MKSAFTFQVTGRGAVITFDPEADYSRLKEELMAHVKQADNFFSGVDLFIDLEGCKFNLEQMEDIMEILNQYKNVGEIFFASNSGSDSSERSRRTRDTILIKRTIRSGQRIKYPTNIVILGDVNPGAEVIAAGDIVVLGKLRGVVHAGAGGLKDAEVVALLLDPTQLRIADLISRPPEQEVDQKGIFPEKAFVKDSSIFVEEIKV